MNSDKTVLYKKTLSIFILPFILLVLAHTHVLILSIIVKDLDVIYITYMVVAFFVLPVLSTVYLSYKYQNLKLQKFLPLKYFLLYVYLFFILWILIFLLMGLWVHGDFEFHNLNELTSVVLNEFIAIPIYSTLYSLLPAAAYLGMFYLVFLIVSWLKNRKI